MATRPFLLETERLAIRTIERTDITEFTRYRNLDEVSRFQDWPLPYTRDLAHELIDDTERLGRPAAENWVQLAVDAGSGIVGDVAVWLDADQTFATIGYTLAPEHQGRGYALEAVAAVVEWLFKRKRVHRVGATIDPRNMASARVLERCGFEYVGTARSSALVRGEWTDDARFSLLEPDWKAWRQRPTSPPEKVTLVEITDDNAHRVGELAVAFSQDEMVAPVLVSIAQAWAPPTLDGEVVQPWLRAIEADGELAGFVMFAEPAGRHAHPYLWRYLIDVHHQGRGIGRRALLDIFRSRRADGATHIEVSWVPDVVGSPAPFYEGLGFVPTGKVHHGEVEALVDLSTLPD